MYIYCPECNKKFKFEGALDEEASCPDCAHSFDVTEDRRKGILRPGTRIAAFEIRGLIGCGGMGQVYEALQLSLHRPVALKILSNKWSDSTKLVQAFLLEVRATASLQHPNIVTVYEADIRDDYLYLAMALINGKSIDRILEENNEPIPEKKALIYCMKVAEAMAYAWRHQKLLHRDIKPANMIIDADDEVKLCDLGIAKRPVDEYELSQAGMAIGTPHYMSPEQGQGLVNVDLRTDMYSLGASLFHMLTATLPFTADNAVSVITKQIIEPLPDPRLRNPEISAPAGRLIEIMMAKLPDERHATWQELIHDFQRVIDGKYPVFQTQTPRPRDTANDNSDTTSQQEPVLPQHGRGGFHLVRAAALLLGLVAFISLLVSSTAHLSGRSRPAQGQLLTPDDGSPALPLAIASQGPPVADSRWVDPLATPPITDPKAPDHQVRIWIHEARTQGLTPIERAIALRRASDYERFEKILWYCLREYPGPDGQWAAAAARELLDYYETRQLTGDMVETLLAMQDFVEIGQAELTAQAYVRLANFFIQENLILQAETTLRDGLRKFGKRYPGIEDVLLLRLLTFLHDQRRTEDLREIIRDVLLNKPENSESFCFAATLAKQYFEKIGPSDEGAPSDREQRLQTIRTTIQVALDQADRELDPAKKAELLFGVAEVYRKADFIDESCQVLQRILDIAEQSQHTALAAKALWTMAETYLKAGRTGEWQRSLNTLLDKKHYGADKRDGLRAARQLADHYGRQRNRTMHNHYLQMIIDEFPGTNGQDAGAAGLQIARNHLSQKHMSLARRILQDVAQNYPGNNQQHREQALTLLKENNLDQSAEPDGPDGNANPVDLGPFKHVLNFDVINEQYVEYTQFNRIISDADTLTIECWFRQKRQVKQAQGLISQHGGNKRGFNLFVEDGRVGFHFSDTERDYIIESDAIDTTQWHHVAVVVRGEGVFLYVDGKRVASRLGRRPVNQGAGRLRVGLFARQPFTHFNGSMQNILIVPGVLYEKDFKPDTEIRHVRHAAACLIADKDGPRELTGKLIQIHGR